MEVTTTSVGSLLGPQKLIKFCRHTLWPTEASVISVGYPAGPPKLMYPTEVAWIPILLLHTQAYYNDSG
jgi:hypothetical protein